MAKSREKFVKLAENRTQKILDTLDLLGNLSNTNNYIYETTDVEQIFGAIRERIKEVESTFKVASERTSRKVFEIKSK